MFFVVVEIHSQIVAISIFQMLIWGVLFSYNELLFQDSFVHENKSVCVCARWSVY
jgi:hypothetical protein